MYYDHLKNTTGMSKAQLLKGHNLDIFNEPPKSIIFDTQIGFKLDVFECYLLKTQICIVVKSLIKREATYQLASLLLYMFGNKNHKHRNCSQN